MGYDPSKEADVHFVVEVSIKRVHRPVVPPANARDAHRPDVGDRVVDELTKIITKAEEQANALNKAIEVLNLEVRHAARD